MVGELAARHVLSKEVVEGLSERTGGVPLFVEEVTRLLLERGEAGGLQTERDRRARGAGRLERRLSGDRRLGAGRESRPPLRRRSLPPQRRLLQAAFRLTKGVELADSDAARAYRAEYPGSPRMRRRPSSPG
jgi:hypothetical protein